MVIDTIETDLTHALSDFYFQEGEQAGCHVDQLRRFYHADYIAQPKQLEFHALCREADKQDGPILIAFGGARGPGKSHAALAQVGIDDCQRVPGLKVLFLRKVQKSAAESLEDLHYRVFRATEQSFTPSAGRISFPNGSRILLGGFNNERDIEKYIGIEYDEIVIEEVTQISFEKLEKLRGSLRSSRDDWRVRMIFSTNPGGIGHLWFKDNLVEPYRAGTWRTHQFLGGYARFIPATYRDNMFLKQDYIDWLESLTGPLGKAWREGDWDSFEGMAFPQWDRNRHVIEPFEIPSWYPRWLGIDWGYAKPFCCLWLARDVDRDRIIVYRELYLAGLTDRQQARMILTHTPAEEGIKTAFADPSMWAKKTYADLVTSTADEYGAEQVFLTRADNDRLSRKRKVDRLLADLPDGRPGLLVFNTCKNLVRTLPSLPLDENNPEDVDTDAEDHAYDALGYGLTNIPTYKPPGIVEKPPITRKRVWSKL